MTIVSRKQPLYDQLVDILKEKIENDLEPGDLLPSERELSLRYGLSRTTVRQAMGELETLGLVKRVHGRGTFVAHSEAEVTNLSAMYSFTDQMRRAGRHPQTKILEFKLAEAPKQVAEKLGLRLGEHIYQLKRLRLVDETPMMLERTYLPATQFIGLNYDEVSTRALYEVMEQEYHQTIRLAQEDFSASIARSDAATYLDIPKGSAILKLVRITFNEKNIPIEFTRSVARADQFNYRITHFRG